MARSALFGHLHARGVEARHPRAAETLPAHALVRVVDVHLEDHLAVVVAALTLTSSSPTVLFSVALVTAGSGVFLIACGVLCELIYSTGNLKVDRFAVLSTGGRD